MPNVNLNNLNRFWTNAKRYIAKRDADHCDWTSIPVNASSYQFEAEPRTPVNPVVEFGFTETLPAEGEKSPTNPSTIAGVDSVTVTKCGKNLCPLIGESSSSYISVSFTDNGEFVFNGSYAGLVDVYVFNKTYDINLFPSYLERGKTYTFSLQGDNSSVKFDVFRYYTTNYGGAVVSIAPGESRTYTIPDTQSMILRFSIPANTVLNNAKFKMQIEEGSTATSFEPYSGTTATVSLGETRYGGTLDVATGKMTVDWAHQTVTNGATTLTTIDASTLQFRFSVTSGDHVASDTMNLACNRFIPGSTLLTTGYASQLYYARIAKTILDVSGAVDPSNPTDAEWLAAINSWLSSNNVEVVYKLATPLTIDLDPQQLFSVLSSSHVNTIFTNTGTISQLTYAKPVPTEADVARFANWQKTETAGAVICAPVPESVLHPTVNFSFTEVPPESGDKSPSNPSTITGVESVNIKKAGKNLFNFIGFSSTKNGVTVTTDPSGIITLNGTSSANNGIATEFTVYGRNIRVAAGKKLSLSYQNISGTATAPQGVTFVIGAQYTLTGTGLNTIYTAVYNYVANENTILLSENRIISNITIKSSGGTVYDNYKIKVQLEINDACTDYEPPVLDVSTVPLNGTYYGGSIDLATGLMTVTHEFHQVTSSDRTAWDSSVNCLTVQYLSDSIGISEANGICTHFPYIGHVWNSNTPHFYRGVSIAYFFNSAWTDKQTALDYFASQEQAGTPVTFVSILATPYTVQLTPTQIKALPALDRCEPRINTLYTNADSIQVEYQKSPIQTEREITNAILALNS